MAAERRTAQAPDTWQEEVSAMAASLKFIWSDLLRKWPILDLTFGIKHLMRRRGNLQVASVYGGSNCVQLKGHAIRAELVHLLRLLNICMFFSKKPFRVFLRTTGYFQEDVLLQVPKAGILKPTFTVLHDKGSKCFLIVIRGMHSMEDILTALNGAVVPFHHSILLEGGGNKLVSGYAHCGMVAAARWIAKCATPYLLEAISKNPDYNVKIVGNSLGGGTAALLTYILREREEFSSSTCIAFSPAACMTWELAESGKHFIITIINGADQVPSCSITSVHNLRSEISSSSWLKDIWNQHKCKRFFSVFNSFTSCFGSCLPFGSNGACVRPISSESQVKCMNNKPICMLASQKGRNSTSDHVVKDSVSLVIERVNNGIIVKNGTDFGCSNGLNPDRGDRIQMYRVTNISDQQPVSITNISDQQPVNEGELMYEILKPLHKREEVVKDIRCDESVAPRGDVGTAQAASLSSDANDSPQFYPPGRLMHMFPAPDSDSDGRIGIYETSRDLYSKIWVSNRMIKDHYMTMCKKTLELLIHSFGEGDVGDGCIDL